MKRMIVGLVLAGCVSGGCTSTAKAFSLEGLVKVDTPYDIQVAEGLPATLPLPKARQARDRYQRTAQENIITWNTNIDGGESTFEFFRGLTLGIGESLAASAGGGTSLLAVAALGYFTRRKLAPTTPEQVAQEKIDSHNHGYNLAIQTLKAVGVKVPDDVVVPPSTN